MITDDTDDRSSLMTSPGQTVEPMRRLYRSPLRSRRHDSRCLQGCSEITRARDSHLHSRDTHGASPTMIRLFTPLRRKSHMRKLIIALVAAALLVPTVALAKGKPTVPGSQSKAAPKVMYVLRGTLTAYTPANGTTNGSVTINVTGANRHGASLRASRSPSPSLRRRRSSAPGPRTTRASSSSAERRQAWATRRRSRRSSSGRSSIRARPRASPDENETMCRSCKDCGARKRRWQSTLPGCHRRPPFRDRYRGSPLGREALNSKLAAV